MGGYGDTDRPSVTSLFGVMGDGDNLLEPSGEDPGTMGDLLLLSLDGVEDGGGVGVLFNVATGMRVLPFSDTKSMDEYFLLGHGMPSILKDIFRCLMDSLRAFSARANRFTLAGGLSVDLMPPNEMGMPKAKRKKVSSLLNLALAL